MCLPYNLNTLSQVAAEAAFDDQAFLARTVSQNAEERAKWEALFDELGFTITRAKRILYSLRLLMRMQMASLMHG